MSLWFWLAFLRRLVTLGIFSGAHWTFVGLLRRNVYSSILLIFNQVVVFVVGL